MIGPLKIDLTHDDSLDEQGQQNIIDYANHEPMLTSMDERGVGGPGTILLNNEPTSRSPTPTDGFRPGGTFDNSTGDSAPGARKSNPSLPTGIPLNGPNYLPTEKENARYKITYQFDLDGSLINSTTEVLLEKEENQEAFDPVNNAWSVGVENKDHGCDCQMGKGEDGIIDGTTITRLNQATPNFDPIESGMEPKRTEQGINLGITLKHESESFDFEEPYPQWKEADIPREDSFNEPSSVVGTVKYFPQEQIMEVELNGRTYPYYGVSYRDFDSFRGAGSKGAAYNRMFKGRFGPGTSVSALANQEALQHAIQYKESIIINNPDDFHWIDEMGIKEMIQEGKKGPGKYVLIKAAEAAITDHRPEGEQFKRMITPEILKKLTYTAIKKGSDINHMLSKRDLNSGVVVDAEFNDKTGFSELIYFESDQEILKAIKDGFITAVSINGGAARSYKIIDKKGDVIENPEVKCSTGECFRLGEGIILGEKDNVAFTWVVTKPGWRYNGRMVPHTIPGVETTRILILE